MSRIINTVPERKKRISDTEFEKKIAAMRERDNEVVTGIFKNYENPGGTVMFGIKLYHGDEFKTYELRDGERYRIPRGVARHLVNNCFYKEYKHLPGEHGETGVRGGFNDGRLRANHMQAARKVHRYGFMSMDFMDDDLDLKTSDIVEVTVSP